MTHRHKSFKRHQSKHSILKMLLTGIIIICSVFLINVFSGGDKPQAKHDTTAAKPTGEDESYTISLLRTESDKTETISMEDYLTGVLSGELSPTYSEEALKAQAVAARTFAVCGMTKGKPNHTADLCDYYGDCQAYYDKEQRAAMWGKKFDEYEAICRKAVQDTAGVIVTYQGEIASTYFHAICGGKTASVKEVWGEDIPYLQSVDCSWDSHAPKYEADASIALKDIKKIFTESTDVVAVSAKSDSNEIPSITGTTESGRADTVEYLGIELSAKDFRAKTGINSTAFSFRRQGDDLIIHTVGYGHGVGLCQEGAEGMAQAGYTYDEILAHYYTGTELTVYNP